MTADLLSVSNNSVLLYFKDQGLKDEYPKVERGYRFLNSGGFIGYAKDIYGIVNEIEIQDEDDDQVRILLLA